MGTRILKIENLLKKSFEKMVGYDSVNVVLGRYYLDEDKDNYICILPIKNGNSVDKKVISIKTTIPNVLDIAELVGLCLLSSNLKFDYIKGSNMDGSEIDLENPETSILFKITF
jgi:hypothetical protein